METSPTNCSTGNFSASLTPATVRTLATNSKGSNPTSTLISLQMVQPVRDVADYLANRKPVPHYAAEQDLFITIPASERSNVTKLLLAFKRVTERVAEGLSVTRACAEVLAQDQFRKCCWNAKSFREDFDNWRRTNDWVCLVNRSKCNAAWKNTTVGLSDAFLDFVASHYLARYARADAKRQAITALHRHWRTGRDQYGEEVIIAGYEKGWKDRVREIIPPGWTYWNILRQINARAKFERSVQAMLHDSTAAAGQWMPQIASTRADMLFLQEVTFDDVRFDYLILNKETGQQEELWALVARDTATGLVLGGVLYPASERPDGTVTHLGARQMKELAGQLLETFPLPPYQVHWKVERGTATISAAVKAALGELFGDRIVVSYTKMLGDKSPVGYKEKKKGNSRGKASHESHNRLFHTAGSFIPGQTGNSYGVRPSDLNARCDEAKQIWQDGQQLPENARAQLKFPLLTLAEARVMFRELSLQQNFRTDHAMEGFNEVVEWYNPADQKIHPKATAPNPLPPSARWLPRMEMPVERAKRLIDAVETWTRCSPAVVIAFLEHKQKLVPVNERGEIQFDHEGKTFTFVHAGQPLIPKTKVLAYFHNDDPGFLHLTDGKGTILGTWLRKGRVRFGDREGLADAMRYTQAAQAAVKERARQLAAPQINELEALRAHNAQVHTFIEVTDAPDAGQKEISTATGAALLAITAERKAKPQRKVSAAESEDETDAALRNAVS